MPTVEEYNVQDTQHQKRELLDEAFELLEMSVLLAPMEHGDEDESIIDYAFTLIEDLELGSEDIESIGISVDGWDNDDHVCRMVNTLSNYMQYQETRDIITKLAEDESAKVCNSANSAMCLAGDLEETEEPETEETDDQDDASEEEGEGGMLKWLTGNNEEKKLDRAIQRARRNPPHQEIIYKQGNEPRTRTDPEVVIPIGVYAQIVELCNLSGANEVGWFGTMRVENNQVFIDEIFLPEQRVTPVTVDISGLPEIALDLMQQGRKDDVARLHFWGHCHPGNGAPGPSGQDEREWNELIADSPIMLMGIFSCDANYAYWRLFYHGVTLRIGWRVVVQKPNGPFFEDFHEKVKR